MATFGEKYSIKDTENKLRIQIRAMNHRDTKRHGGEYHEPETEHVRYNPEEAKTAITPQQHGPLATVFTYSTKTWDVPSDEAESKKVQHKQYNQHDTMPFCLPPIPNTMRKKANEAYSKR